MNEIQMSKGLGLVSLVVGTVQVVAGRRLKHALGLPMPTSFVRAFGVRELLTGFAALAHPDDKGPMAVRIMGDAVDLAVLGVALLPGNRKRPAAAMATAAVVGLTVLDFIATAAQTQREHRALATARRTRINRPPTAAIVAGPPVTTPPPQPRTATLPA